MPLAHLNAQELRNRGYRRVATVAQVRALVGKRVRVHAPESCLHALQVTVHCVSPKYREVLRTSEGPLQWTRRDLLVKVLA